MSQLINSAGQHVSSGTDPKILSPSGRPVTTSPPPNAADLRPTREWQILLNNLQLRVREYFLSSFPDPEREAMEKRLAWRMHPATMAELLNKLKDSVKTEGRLAVIQGWPVFESVAIVPGALSVEFRVISSPTTPEFQTYVNLLRADAKTA